MTLHPYAFPVLTSALFAAAIFFGVLPRDTLPPEYKQALDITAKVLLTLGFLALGAWFVHSFTHADRAAGDESCQAERRASMFRFAYMFSIFSFALLVLPFTAMLRSHETTPDAGPIRLLRACVEPPAARAASAPTPVEFCPDPAPSHAVSYPWLVSVGGVLARECDSGNQRCAELPALYRVQGGLVVPFYVVVFAFVGGVVNLTRRIPEYQKRSSCDFNGTATETKVSLLEAREFVVFQLMQLITSPFIAMVAYYALEPKSVASAVALGFFSGFSTEWVLLLLRGMFAGLQPATTKTVSSHANAQAQLHLAIKKPDGSPADKAKVALKRLPSGPVLKTETADASGAAQFKALDPGTVWITATLDNPGGQPATLSATQKAQLKGGETEALELTLG